MARMTSRLAGWVAGRLKGEKARKSTMNWMDKTGLGQLLGVAGDVAIAGGALKGAGALKNLLMASRAGTTSAALPGLPSAGQAVTTVGERAASAVVPPASAPALTPTPIGRAATDIGSRVAGAVTPPTTAAMPAGISLRPMPQMGGAVTSVAPRVAAPIAPPVMEAPEQASRLGEMLKGGAKAVGRGAMAAGRFAKENVAPLSYGASAISESLASSRRTALEEEQMRLEQERRNRLAELLMPLFQAEVQRYGQSNRG